ncbi:hypothetical protein FRB95_003141, partial [Tulasnella sp. JGI-2019a]
FEFTFETSGLVHAVSHLAGGVGLETSDSRPHASQREHPIPQLLQFSVFPIDRQQLG